MQTCENLLIFSTSILINTLPLKLIENTLESFKKHLYIFSYIYFIVGFHIRRGFNRGQTCDVFT